MAHRLSRLLVAALILLAACGSGSKFGGRPLVELSDEELYEAARDALDRGDEMKAREYLRRYEVRYPRGGHIEEVKFYVAETYYQRGMREEQVEGVALFRSFLTFYPRHPLGCDAQFKIGKYFQKKMRSPERDQTETRQAIQELQKVIANYPDCHLADEARVLLRSAFDRLAESDFKVGQYYYKIGQLNPAEHRFRDLLATYPDFTQRDMVQYYLVDTLRRIGYTAEAEEIYRVLATEYPASKWAEKARDSLGLHKEQ